MKLQHQIEGNPMNNVAQSRRRFLKTAGLATGALLLSPENSLAQTKATTESSASDVTQADPGAADYTLHIKNSPIEIAPKRIISATTYNGQFPGPLLRFKEGQEVIIDIYNDTDTPEQLHWHGQQVPVDVDGAAEEGTPFIPPRGKRRITFTPRPAGLRFYHTHVRAGANLAAGQYSGQVGAVYIEPKHEPGRYDREVFLVLKEFEPTLSRGGDMAQNFLSPSTKVKELEQQGESAMKASLAAGNPHGYEVGYGSFTINGRMLGHGDPIRVKRGERVLFHILNGSATEIRSLALPGHLFTVIALDGNAIPKPTQVPGLWLGTAERVSAIVEMNHPGVWIMGDLADDDRHHGMGIVVEYAGGEGKPQWISPKPFRWNYAHFAGTVASSEPDQVFDMTFAKQNAAQDGFNLWTINDVAFSGQDTQPVLRVEKDKRYRLRMQNATDDIHPIHLHRHSFELTQVDGQKTFGVMKDVVMVGGYQQVDIDFTADNPGMTLFHCHQQ